MKEPERKPHSRKRRGRAILAGCLVLATPACESGSPVGLRVTVLASPAGAGSVAPFLSPGRDGVWMSWLEADGNDHRLLLAQRIPEGVPADGATADGTWSPVREAGRSDNYFVNWADFPVVVEDARGRLWTHWLERGAAGGYDYGVRLVSSEDGGATWSQPISLHDDGSPVEHGFVSSIGIGDGASSDAGSGAAFVWLDGRKMAPDADAESEREMTIRYREVAFLDGQLSAGPEILLDGRTCECCQTDMAATSDGPAVVYRDRSPDEIRDIRIVRRVDDRWSEPMPVHRDGWHFEGCPVNGPALAVSGERLAVLWFTGADGRPQVKAAVSTDSGASFSAPLTLDRGDPIGRVELVGMGDGSFLAFWLERTDGGGADLVALPIDGDGRAGSSATVGKTAAGRAAGFPRAALEAPGRVLVAWTETEPSNSVRIARVEAKSLR